MEQFSVTGMSCAACAARVEKAVNKVDGVTSCAVSLLTNSMGVQGNADPQKIIQAVKAAGYGAALVKTANGGKTESCAANGCQTGNERGAAKSATQDQDPLADRESPVLVRRLAISLIFLVPLMYFSMGRQMLGLPLPKFFEGNCVAVGLVQLLLAAAVMVVNKKFFTSGISTLFRVAPNMDSLVALGSGASFAYSAAVLFVMTKAVSEGDAGKAHELLHDLYFEGAAMILALITVGKTLEARSKGKTTNALKSLMKLAPKTATVIRDGKELVIPASQILVGEIFVVRPGQSFPVDGTVVEGNGAVDESALTGESVPVDKKSGDKVFGGTLNQAGFLKCQASRVGQDTTISQIIKMVGEAAATKAPAQKIADKVSGVFVPAVIAIAAVTVAAWLLAGQDFGFALARGISVLVISCPCALGLATPVAIMVANGVGAKNGILFKTAAALEQTGKTKIAALDKTGTITQGRPRVTDIFCAQGVGQQQLLEAALSLELKSEHPLAKAVLQKASELSLTARPVTDFKALAGSGVLAIDQDGSQLLGGSVAFVQTQLEQSGSANESAKSNEAAASGAAKIFPQNALAAADAFAEQGKTPLAFARANKLLGIIAVADVIKQDSAAAIKDLRALGVETVMLTGDNQKAAAFVAQEACVDQVIAGVLPDQKATTVGQLKKCGAVAMVGDGINDAVALTAADIGIAIGAGADVAIDAADVVLAKNSLRDVVTAIRLSRACLRNIRQNLFWAFFYNVLGIPLAAGAWIWLLGWKLNPMFGAAAMSLSSVCVVTNALRLNFFSGSKNDDKTKMLDGRNVGKEKNMKKTIKVEGMMCGHCEARVVKALQAVEGVASATASHDTGLAVVELSADVSNDALKAAVEAQDYKVLGVE
ncbi:MAG: heavy metal translocating P-type ATPase [Treponema sp.]|nr:heavy metal translocating P-type ATPase [Treponema sp.]